MNPASRRSFLGLAGTGAATAALAVVATPAGASPTAAAPATPLPAGAEGSLVAHVKDVQQGLVTVMVAGRAVDVTDHELVARLAAAATKA